MPRKKSEKFDFETAIDNLETIVDDMEAGDLTLEEAMAHFEQGVKLTRDCHKALQQAEQKVKVLIEKQGSLELADFADDDFDLDADDE